MWTFLGLFVACSAEARTAPRAPGPSSPSSPGPPDLPLAWAGTALASDFPPPHPQARDRISDQG